MKFTDEQAKAALEATGGLVAQAAEQLGVSRQSLHERVNKNPELQGIRSASLEIVKDMAEGKILAAIKKGERWAIEYFMDHHAQDRGWGRRLQLTGRGGGPIQTVDMTQEQFEKWFASLTDEQQRAYTGQPGATGLGGGSQLPAEEPGQGSGDHGAGASSEGDAPEEAI